MFCDRLVRNFSLSARYYFVVNFSEPDFVSWLNGFVNFIYFPWALQRRLSCHWAFPSPCNKRWRCTTSAQSVLFSISSSKFQPSRDLLPESRVSTDIQIHGPSIITTIGRGRGLGRCQRMRIALSLHSSHSHHIFHLFTYILFSKTTRNWNVYRLCIKVVELEKVLMAICFEW